MHWPVGSKSPVHCYKNLFNASGWPISTGRQACSKQEQKNTVPRSECFYFRLLFYVIQLIAVMLSAIFYLLVFHWQPKIKECLYLWGLRGQRSKPGFCYPLTPNAGNLFCQILIPEIKNYIFFFPEYSRTINKNSFKHVKRNIHSPIRLQGQLYLTY